MDKEGKLTEINPEGGKKAADGKAVTVISTGVLINIFCSLINVSRGSS
jgi:hypothetical protein